VGIEVLSRAAPTIKAAPKHTVLGGVTRQVKVGTPIRTFRLEDGAFSLFRCRILLRCPDQGAIVSMGGKCQIGAQNADPMDAGCASPALISWDKFFDLDDGVLK